MAVCCQGSFPSLFGFVCSLAHLLYVRIIKPKDSKTTEEREGEGNMTGMLRQIVDNLQ
jgi:hypothetical protein